MSRAASAAKRGAKARSVRLSFVIALLLLVTGTAASVEAWRRNQQQEEETRAEFFRIRANELNNKVRREFELPIEALRVTTALFQSVPYVREDQFRNFVAPVLTRYPTLVSVEWAELVRDADRALFEAPDLNGLAIIHRLGESVPEPAPRSPIYLPIRFSEPPTRRMLGTDLLLDPSRLAHLETAAATAEPVLTPSYLADPSDENSRLFTAYLAAYPASSSATDLHSPSTGLRGVAIGTLAIRRAMDRALREFNLGGMSIALYDTSERGHSLLFVSSKAHALQMQSDLARSIPFAFGHRDWRVDIAPEALPRPSAWDSIDLIAGLAATLLLSLGSLGIGALVYLLREADDARKLGKYTLLEPIGRGGMGVVYRARHALLRRETAVKVLKPENETDREAVARFEREVHLTTRLTHPNTIAIYDYGRTRQGEFYYVMELVRGLSLETLVRTHGPQPAGRVIHLMRQVAGALWEAHDAGLVHRDVKPENVMVTCRGPVADFVKVLDFGLGKDSKAPDPHLTQADMVVGTPLYMSPEQLRRQPLDGRADIYSLGTVAYFLLTGTDVFTGGSSFDIGMKHLEQDPEPPSRRLGVRIAPSLEQIVMRCLEKNPASRYADAGELLEALDVARSFVGWTNAEALEWWREEHPEVLSMALAGDAFERSGSWRG
jgi:serine/threonine-protein kinase